MTITLTPRARMILAGVVVGLATFLFGYVIGGAPSHAEAAPAASVTDDGLGGTADPSQIAAALATPCATEDSTDCYWDAAVAGNGSGVSFVSIDGSYYPLPR